MEADACLAFLKPAVVVFPSLGCSLGPWLWLHRWLSPTQPLPWGTSNVLPLGDAPSTALDQPHRAQLLVTGIEWRLFISSGSRKFNHKKLLLSSKVEPLSDASRSELGWFHLLVGGVRVRGRGLEQEDL